MRKVRLLSSSTARHWALNAFVCFCLGMALISSLVVAGLAFAASAGCAYLALTN